MRTIDVDSPKVVKFLCDLGLAVSLEESQAAIVFITDSAGIVAAQYQHEHDCSDTEAFDFAVRTLAASLKAVTCE